MDAEGDEVHKLCLDYICYENGDEKSKQFLYPYAVLDVPPEHVIAEHAGLPSAIFPSDHLPIYAAFKLKQALQ